MSKPERDYSETLFLPQTDFPMRAGLPQKEPEILKRWQDSDLYKQLRETSKGRDKFVLHDGPPYANGPIHIGTALNKILKDMVTRSQQMLGYDSNYVPGWDCHGLPIEWKIEEENYRSKGQPKPNLNDPAAMVAFRQECRAYAAHWLNVQREEFKRLGVIGDWAHPYTTMDFFAEAQIARELMKFAANGLLYRGSKPVMWSVVEKTALAEAEVEYEDYTSDTVWVKFPIATASWGGNVTFHDSRPLHPSQLVSVVIWTTTPWTLPGNRAISFSPKVSYSVYEVVDAPEGNWTKRGDKFLLADSLAVEVMKQARVTNYKKLAPIKNEVLEDITCDHPLRGFAGAYSFPVPLLPGEHVTDETGTGFVHTAPGHGREDFDVWTANRANLRSARHQHRHSLHRRRKRRIHRSRARFHGQTRHQRQRREGRRERSGHQRADRCEHAHRALAPQASIPAFVAIEEAGDLPQYAAVVHCDGPAVCRGRWCLFFTLPLVGRVDRRRRSGWGSFDVQRRHPQPHPQPLPTRGRGAGCGERTNS